MNSPGKPFETTRPAGRKSCEDFASSDFWTAYARLPGDVRELADKSFALLKENPRQPSLHFRKVGRYWSARVGLKHRALAVEADDGLVWFWIGSHTHYDRLRK